MLDKSGSRLEQSNDPDATQTHLVGDVTEKPKEAPNYIMTRRASKHRHVPRLTRVTHQTRSTFRSTGISTTMLADQPARANNDDNNTIHTQPTPTQTASPISYQMGMHRGTRIDFQEGRKEDVLRTLVSSSQPTRMKNTRCEQTTKGKKKQG